MLHSARARVCVVWVCEWFGFVCVCACVRACVRFGCMCGLGVRARARACVCVCVGGGGYFGLAGGELLALVRVEVPQVHDRLHVQRIAERLGKVLVRRCDRLSITV